MNVVKILGLFIKMIQFLNHGSKESNRKKTKSKLSWNCLFQFKKNYRFFFNSLVSATPLSLTVWC